MNESLTPFINLLYHQPDPHGLISLADNSYEVNGRNTLEIPSNNNYKEPAFNSFINHQDILKCSEDLKYITSELFYLHPGINNPIRETRVINGKLHATYFQNAFDRRYSMLVSCAFEKAYNFWDRIGDRIASFYPDLLKVKQVDFVRIIDQISAKEEVDSLNFKWLVDFKDSDYKELNSIRRNVVHYSQVEANYRHELTIFSDDMDKVSDLYQTKSDYPKYFRIHLHKMTEGYFKMVDFLLERKSELGD
ncbi:MAG: hypothetical protein ACJAR3_002660 [Roseivirga sp.]|jgi:hypothetical protein